MYFINRANLDRKNGGLSGLKIPLLSDFNKKVTKDYNLLIEKDGVALRGDYKVALAINSDIY